MTIIIKDSGALSWKVSGVFLGALRILFPLGGVLLLSKFPQLQMSGKAGFIQENVSRGQKEH